jgi:hypothetical protein
MYSEPMPAKGTTPDPTVTPVFKGALLEEIA